MSTDTSILIVKPDAVARVDEIVEYVKSQSFEVIERSTITLTSTIIADLSLASTPSDSEHLTDSTVQVFSLRKKIDSGDTSINTVSDLCKLAGPIDPVIAKTDAPESLRARFGTDIVQNAVYVSETNEMALRDHKTLIVSSVAGATTVATTATLPSTSGKAAKEYLEKSIAPILTKALTEMCSASPEDPTKWLGEYLLRMSANKAGPSGISSTIATTEDTSGATIQSHQPKIYFVLGNAGSGKGTQCAKLVEKYGFGHLSAGDLLRAEVKSGSEQGEMIAALIQEGKIVPGEITLNLLKKAIEDSNDKPGILVDGFPRELTQAGSFEKNVSDFEFVLFFDCPEDELERRLLERGKTSGRTDDNTESIRKRFRTFRETCYPVIQYYESKGKAYRVDATRSIDDIFDEVCGYF